MPDRPLRGRQRQVYAMIKENPYLNYTQMAKLIGDGATMDIVFQAAKSLIERGYVEIIPAHFRILIHKPLTVSEKRTERKPQQHGIVRSTVSFNETLAINERWLGMDMEEEVVEVDEVPSLRPNEIPPAEKPPLPQQNEVKGL